MSSHCYIGRLVSSSSFALVIFFAKIHIFAKMLFVSKITSEGSKFRVTREMQRWAINSELFFQQVLRWEDQEGIRYAKYFEVNRPYWTFLDLTPENRSNMQQSIDIRIWQTRLCRGGT
jgi:hypothetical protein